MPMNIKIINDSNNPDPDYGTPGSAAADIRAHLQYPMTLPPHSRVLVPTGLRMQIPPDSHMMILSRSGLAAKHGVFVLNAPGIVDNDYTQEIKVILANMSEHTYMIKPGDKIAQFIIFNQTQHKFEPVDAIEETERTGGFGSTGY